MKTKQLFSITLILVILFSLSGCLRSREGPKGPVALTFYGLDNSDVFQPIISKYKEKYRSVTINYKKFNNVEEFEHLLINEIAEGEGPDIFYLHNTWLPRHIKKIVSLESETLTPEKFPEAFVNVTAQDFIQPDPANGNKKIYALPLYVDTLALYYNKEHFEQKLPQRGKPANNWDQLKEEVAQLRQQSQDGVLSQGAIAMGRSDNIRLAADIIYNLFLQAGVEFYDSDFKQIDLTGAQEYFDYFLSFGLPQNKNFSWDLNLAPFTAPLAELEAFLSGKVSAIFAYANLYPQLETALKNVKSRADSVIELNDIGIMPVPQIATNEADYKVFADYYGLAVSRNSKNAKLAWDFIQFATSKENAQVFHKETKLPTARRDLIEEQKKEPITDVFVSQVGYAGSYRIFSDQKFDKILGDALSSAISGQTSRQALENSKVKMNEVLKLEAPQGLYPKPKVKK